MAPLELRLRPIQSSAGGTDEVRSQQRNIFRPPPLPAEETRRGFVARYAEDSGLRLAALERCDDAWWEADTDFFDTVRSRAWVMVRRVAHTSHHRGQQMAMLRMLCRDLYSTYGPTADTGGLMQDHAPVIYAYSDLEALLRDAPKAPLPEPVDRPVTKRP